MEQTKEKIQITKKPNSSPLTPFGGHSTPQPGNLRADCNIRADEFSNGKKEVEGGTHQADTRPEKPTSSVG